MAASHSRLTVDPSSLEQAMELLQGRIDQLQRDLADQGKLATLGMMAAVLAHEFNNILTPMIAYTTVAVSDKSDDALRRKALEKALSGALRLSNISQSLLGFARNGGDNSPCVANVKQVVEETLSCLGRDFAKDAITLTLEIPESLQVGMNPGQLQQVLLNLIVNARAAMLSPEQVGPRRLTIVARPQDNHLVHISVADTGPGFAADIADKIFEPFFSTKKELPPSPQEASDSLPRGGTGLGLTICHQLITAAGGTIHAASSPGRGATFTLELPASLAPQP
ncbi:MAG: ATP-binding protein [Phycisphaerales bacterium]|nr:ATP-binding protein [Phycisphaerales bacterium]